MVNLNGRYNQIKGPFEAGVDLLAPGGAIDLKTPETTRPVLYKLGIIAPSGTKVQINDADAEISDFGVLELDTCVNVKSLIFPEGAPDGTIIDFVY